MGISRGKNGEISTGAEKLHRHLEAEQGKRPLLLALCGLFIPIKLFSERGFSERSYYLLAIFWAM
jgi:hypothetical protein